MSAKTPRPSGLSSQLPSHSNPAGQTNGDILSGIVLHNGERKRSNFTSIEKARAEDSCPQTGVNLEFSETEDTRVEGSGCRTGTKGPIPASPERLTQSPVSSVRDRVGCYTWNWFTMTMATGGIANVLFSTPYEAEWLRIVGTVVCVFNIALFLMNATLLTLKFWWIPGSFKASFTTQSESLFVSACVVSTGIILINICQYGIPHCGQWLQTTMQICFWAYLCVAVLASSCMYLIIWSTQAFPIHTMTPIWIFPAYPLLLLAPLAANLINALPSPDAAARIGSVAIALGAVCVQGTGFLVSLMIYSAFIYRLMTQKLPRETRRPGMFVSVGPSGFTVAGIVRLGNIVEAKILPGGFMSDPRAPFILKLLASMLGLWLWGLCLWFFLVSVGAHLPLFPFSPLRPKGSEKMRFEMTWYSFVFPNTAMVTATHAISVAFESNAIRIVGITMSVALVGIWVFVFVMMVRAFCERRLLWPDDVDRGSEVPEKWKSSGAKGEV